MERELSEDQGFFYYNLTVTTPLLPLSSSLPFVPQYHCQGTGKHGLKFHTCRSWVRRSTSPALYILVNFHSPCFERLKVIQVILIMKLKFLRIMEAVFDFVSLFSFLEFGNLNKHFVTPQNSIALPEYFNCSISSEI